MDSIIEHKDEYFFFFKNKKPAALNYYTCDFGNYNTYIIYAQTAFYFYTFTCICI